MARRGVDRVLQIALNAVGEPGKVRVETLVLQGARS